MFDNKDLELMMKNFNKSFFVMNWFYERTHLMLLSRNT